MKETRKLHGNDLRVLCIEKGWYTKGCNESYGKLLSFANSIVTVTTEDIVQIAQDILNNSETEYPLEAICFEVARICSSIFEG